MLVPPRTLIHNGNASFLSLRVLQSKGQEKNLLRDLALSREQLKRDLAAARQELELVAGSADAAKEEAAVQINMLSRQLTGAQAQVAAAEKVRGRPIVWVAATSCSHTAGFVSGSTVAVPPA